MSGKLEGYKNDTILFNVRGNKLKFKTADLVSVYFNEKDASDEPEKGTIATEIDPLAMGQFSGTVNYLTHFEFKPDFGADVYFADSTNLRDFNHATLDSFYNYVIYKTYLRNWTPRPANKLLANIYDEGEKYNYNKASFKLLDKRTTMNISKIVNAKNTTKAIVDKSGNYSVKVRPGIYYVLFKSRNSSRLDKFETAEWFKCYKVNIGKGESISLSYSFGFEFK